MIYLSIKDELSVQALLIVVVMILGVLGVVTTQNSRKRARGITWFPENFFPANGGLRQSGRKADKIYMNQLLILKKKCERN